MFVGSTPSRRRNVLNAGSHSSKVRQTAAWHLIYQRLEVFKLEAQVAARLPPPPPSDAQLIADFVAAHTPEQLKRLAIKLF